MNYLASRILRCVALVTAFSFVSACVSTPNPQIFLMPPASATGQATTHATGGSISQPVDTVNFHISVVDAKNQPLDFSAAFTMDGVGWLVPPWASLKKSNGNFLLGKSPISGTVAIYGTPAANSGVYYVLKLSDFLEATDITFIIKQPDSRTLVIKRKQN